MKPIEQYCFESFIVGNSNQLAYEAAKAFAERNQNSLSVLQSIRDVESIISRGDDLSDKIKGIPL